MIAIGCDHGGFDLKEKVKSHLEEKGYEVKDVNNWDSNIIKQSSDISGDLLKQGFIDMTGF